MQKTSIIVHQSYLDDVIKRLHETGFMEIIDISKEETSVLEELEKSKVHPDSEVLNTYE